MAELGRLSAWELREWQAFEAVYGPIGADRTDQLAAMITKTMVNMFRPKGTKEATIRDYLPKWGYEEMNGDGSGQHS